MQTFLPYPDFKESAKCLDNKRLGKQRSEAKIMLLTNLGESDGWKNHPAVLMWKGYECSLVEYGIAICHEWRDRGFRDTVLQFFLVQNLLIKYSTEEPSWLGSSLFHDSHKSNLLRKDYVWYSQFGWTVPTDLPYHWPVRKNNGNN